MSVLAFLCRLLVFELLSVVSTFAAREYSMSLYGRVLVSTLQVMVFCAFWVLLQVVMFLVLAMQEGRFYKSVVDQGENAGRSMSSEELQEATGLTEDELVETLEAEVSPETLRAQTLEAETTCSVTTHATERGRTIVFTSREALRDHVMHVYGLGVLLWVSIYCLDFTLESVPFFMVVGMYATWAVSLAWKSGQRLATSCAQLAYVLLLGALLMAYWVMHSELLLPAGHSLSREMMLAVLVPTAAGGAWMVMPPKSLVRSVGESFFTCVLLCLPVLAFAGMEPLRKLWECEAWLLVWLFAVEPLLKGLAVYVIALTLQTGRRAELLVTIALAVQLDDVLFFEGRHVERALTWLLMGMAFLTHVFCLAAAESF